MEMTAELHAKLRTAAAGALRDYRRFRGISQLAEWYDGRYRAYKNSARLLEIALYHDKCIGELRK